MRQREHGAPGERRRLVTLGVSAAALVVLAVVVAVTGGWKGVASTIREMAYGPAAGQKNCPTSVTATFPKSAKTGKAFPVSAVISASAGCVPKGSCQIVNVSGAVARQSGLGRVKGGRCAMKATVGRPGRARLRVAFRAQNASGAKTFLRDSQSKISPVKVTGAANLKLSIEGFALKRSEDLPSAVTPSGGTIVDCTETQGFAGTLVGVYTFVGDPLGLAFEQTWQTPNGPQSPQGFLSPGRSTFGVSTTRPSPNGSYSVTLTLRDAPRGTPTGPPLATAQGLVTVNCPAPVLEP